MARYRRFDLRTRDDTDQMTSVRLRRAGLKSAMSGLELAIAAPAPGRIGEWAQGVRVSLSVLQEVWTRHVVETEAPGAFLDDILAESPRLSNQVARLREEHGETLSTLLRVEQQLLRVQIDDDWTNDVRVELTGLLCSLARHRQRGADLVYEAYDVDIGGSS
ncbi:MAG: hypothetical protein ACT4OX_03690 [Actinomycetota bacterium]